MVWVILIVLSMWSWVNTSSAPLPVFAQGATVTDTPTSAPAVGMTITVTTTTEDHANVRTGPGSAIYPVVGTLPVGATAPALGRSPGGDWVQIEFPSAPGGKGWVYTALVTVSPGTLPIIEPPPTPLPPPTSTIDPTLAAQFNQVPTATRLPTFTPPPVLVAPIYTDSPSAGTNLPIPAGVIILSLGSLGLIGLLFSINRRNLS